MILAAGYGTRLRPLTDELPKPLLPFGDRSFLEHAVRAATRAGLGEPIANAHHLFDILVNQIKSLNLKIEVVHEASIRGTAGGVFGARSRLGPAPIVVLNGDAVFEEVPRDFAESARELHLVLAVVPRARGQGTVGIGAGGRVVRLRGECFGPEQAGGDYIGLCALGERGLSALPELGCLVGDFALPLLRRGEVVETYAFSSDVWLPADDLASYWRGNLEWLARHSASGVSVGVGVSVGSEVELVESIVAPGARLVGRGVIRRCVVLPGARVEAPLADAIVTPAGRVVPIPSAEAGR
jgi:mannose-1-phosphate guanylyltransferase